MNPHHNDLLAHGYEFKRKYPKMGQTGATHHYVHKETGHKVHVEKMHRDVHSLYSDDGKGRQLLVKDAAAAAKHGGGLKEEVLTEDLNSALKDLKQELAGGKEYSPEMLKGIADDWEVNPALLIRKFKEATGKDPADYKIMDKETMGKVVFEAGKKKATEWVKHNIQGGTSSLLGKPFTYKDKETGQESQYVAAAWTGRGLHGWNITKQAIYTISFPNSTAAAKYIDAHILSVK